MALNALATAAIIIKPDDLVRTRDGKTARCLEILPGHRRRLENTLTGTKFIAHVEELHLVQAAPPRRWPSHLG